MNIVDIIDIMNIIRMEVKDSRHHKSILSVWRSKSDNTTKRTDGRGLISEGYLTKQTHGNQGCKNISTNDSINIQISHDGNWEESDIVITNRRLWTKIPREFSAVASMIMEEEKCSSINQGEVKFPRISAQLCPCDVRRRPSTNNFPLKLCNIWQWIPSTVVVKLWNLVWYQSHLAAGSLTKQDGNIRAFKF